MQRKVPPLEHKLTALYAMDVLGEVTNLQLLQFMVEHDLMDYFALQPALFDLISTGYIKKEQHPLGVLYHLTPEGIHALGLFLKRIPQSKRFLIDESAPMWRRRFAKEREVFGTSHALPQGGSQLELMIRQDSRYLLLILLRVLDKNRVQQYLKSFALKANAIYAGIFEMLSRGYTPGGCKLDTLPSCAVPVQGQADLIEFRAGDFSVILPLPDRDMACQFAGAWQTEHEKLFDMIIGMLNE